MARKARLLQWSAGAFFLAVVCSIFPLHTIATPLSGILCPMVMPLNAPRSPVELSQAYLKAVKAGQDTEGIRQALAGLTVNELQAALQQQSRRQAFWINLYNALAQESLNKETMQQASARNKAFRKKRLTVAGNQMSLNDIEHGMLRKSNLLWGLGFLRNPFPGSFERRLRVHTLDPRIHFALNCGAASCPPIHFYEPDQLSRQLDRATMNYLHQMVEKDHQRVKLPKVFSWFRGDFGGKEGIYTFLRRYELIAPTERPALAFQGWDWSPQLGKFSSLE